ncbi:MAG: ATP synthase F1 subunit delta [Vicinamibacterales bacterium]
MSLKSSANRYARVLFDVAHHEGDVSQVDRDLSAIAEVVREHADALQPMLRRNVQAVARRAVIEALADQLGLSALVRKLLGVLAEGGRFDLVPLVAEAYRERLLTHQNIVRARVTSATPLTPESTKALEASLGGATGKNVELSMAVDKDLIGGLVARIGSTVYDGSVRTQLNKIRRTLVE